MKVNWKTRVLIIGALAGVFAGLGAAYILIQRSEKEDQQPRLSAGEGVQIGLGILGLLRLIASMGEK
jgi:membrane associated rhomboid family serine protease